MLLDLLGAVDVHSVFWLSIRNRAQELCKDMWEGENCCEHVLALDSCRM